MTFCVENETKKELPFDAEDIADKVIHGALEYEKCPYEVIVNVLLTDNGKIRALNNQFRETDKPTDVLSFPNVDYESPADFGGIEDDEVDYFDLESGELYLGDIVISVDKVYEQAEEYGHSVKREYAFLLAHSMLHLLGYDHMEPKEAAVMEQKQEEILDRLGITRAEESSNNEEKEI